jgi:hypothetical protein
MAAGFGAPRPTAWPEANDAGGLFRPRATEPGTPSPRDGDSAGCRVQVEASRRRPGLVRSALQPEETAGLTRSGDLSRMLPAEAHLLAAGWPRAASDGGARARAPVPGAGSLSTCLVARDLCARSAPWALCRDGSPRFASRCAHRSQASSPRVVIDSVGASQGFAARWGDGLRSCHQ